MPFLSQGADLFLRGQCTNEASHEGQRTPARGHSGACTPQLTSVSTLQSEYQLTLRLDSLPFCTAAVFQRQREMKEKKPVAVSQELKSALGAL